MCRPSPDEWWISRVRITVSPMIWLINVDLPAPDGPSNTPVRAGCNCSTIAARPSPLKLLVTMTGVPAATDSRSLRMSSDDSARSAFVSTTTGAALPRDREIPLRAADVDVGGGDDDESHVHIGRKHLAFRLRPG